MTKTHWYKNAVVYQIYPFSYKDSNNDGWGDIEGIISKLDYIKNLGVSAIWFSPLYDSPDYDYGYDIKDYRAIDSKFGTMDDFDRLLDECHSRNLKVIMDMVINHTSIEHEWFKKALESKDSPYRDYYIIRQGKRKGNKLLPPTNWNSSFTGSAWERINNTDEYYLHLFCKEQADLNWENLKVRQEIEDILNFWLSKGVDGFRFDVFNLFSKVYPFEDDPAGGVLAGTKYFVDGPRIHEFLKEINEKALSLYDSYTVGETYMPSIDNCIKYIDEDSHELDSVFNFEHLASDSINGLKFFKKPFDIKQFKDGLFNPQRDYYGKGWNTLVLENHDVPRSICRFGLDYKKYRYEVSALLSTITYMGFGIPFIYMGQEIGSINTDFNNIDEMKDPVSHFVFDLLRHYKVPQALAFKFINFGCRDHARVPMQWDNSVNAGFNNGHIPWQRMNNHLDINVENDLKSNKSIYAYYQKLIEIKKTNDIAINGKLEEYDHNNKKVIAYTRTYNDKKIIVVGNFKKHNIKYDVPCEFKNAKILLSNYDCDNYNGKLKPYQVVVLEQQ